MLIYFYLIIFHNKSIIENQLRETQSLETQEFILGNPHGEENPKRTFLNIDSTKYKVNTMLFEEIFPNQDKIPRYKNKIRERNFLF